VRLVVLPGAALEAEEAAAFYESRREGLGERFLARVDEAVQRALETPHQHQRWGLRPDVRRVRVKRFPYLVFYLVENDELLVTAIAATAQEPGYWFSRLEP
jgi:toxin ParE1/3/4